VTVIFLTDGHAPIDLGRNTHTPLQTAALPEQLHSKFQRRRACCRDAAGRGVRLMSVSVRSRNQRPRAQVAAPPVRACWTALDMGYVLCALGVQFVLGEQQKTESDSDSEDCALPLAHHRATRALPSRYAHD
jgi:hypothetical protein